MGNLSNDVRQIPPRGDGAAASKAGVIAGVLLYLGERDEAGHATVALLHRI
jgi:hypothetical protein